jgi:hypothetical protein
MPRGPRESKEVVARTTSPFFASVPAACQTRWTPGPHHDLASLRHWLAGWPPLGNTASPESSYWKRSQMVVAFGQKIAVMQMVYGLRLPEYYQDWMGFLELFEIDWSAIVFPGSCLSGGFFSRLLLRGLGPLALVAYVLVVGATVGAARRLVGRKVALKLERASQRDGKMYNRHTFLELCQKTLLDTLPALLFILLCITPTTSTSIFAAWTCETFALDSTAQPPTTVRFLGDDLSLKCDGSSDEYSRVVSLASIFVGIWPVGVPLLFLALLLTSRAALREGRSSRLVAASCRDLPPACRV